MANQNEKPNSFFGNKGTSGTVKQNKSVGSGDLLFWGVMAVALIVSWPLAVVLGILRLSGNERLQRSMDKLNKKQVSSDVAKRTGASVVQMEKTAENEYTMSDRADLQEFGEKNEWEEAPKEPQQPEQQQEQQPEQQPEQQQEQQQQQEQEQQQEPLPEQQQQEQLQEQQEQPQEQPQEEQQPEQPQARSPEQMREPPYDSEPEQTVTAPNGPVENASFHDASVLSDRERKEISEKNIKKARLLQAAGIVLAAGGAALASRAVGAIIGIGWYAAVFKPVLDAACMLGGGAVLHTSGTAIKKREQRFKQYLAVIGNRKVVNISDLGKVADATHHRVYADLEKMMELGLLPASAYIDRGRDFLVLDPAALEQERREEMRRNRIAYVQAGMLKNRFSAVRTKRSGAELTEEEKTLQEIRRLNDDIADAEMSVKIDKIENITRAIFALLQKNPERRPEVRNFFSYYLPTTLKMLNFYAQLEDQPAQGATILEARQNIEGIMDALLRGFEAQLDSLFRADALDISSDIRVIETMLAQDGIDNSEQQDAIARITRMAQREPRRAADGRELTASVPKLF